MGYQEAGGVILMEIKCIKCGELIDEIDIECNKFILAQSVCDNCQVNQQEKIRVWKENNKNVTREKK